MANLIDLNDMDIDSDVELDDIADFILEFSSNSNLSELSAVPQCAPVGRESLLAQAVLSAGIKEEGSDLVPVLVTYNMAPEAAVTIPSASPAVVAIPEAPSASVATPAVGRKRPRSSGTSGAKRPRRERKVKLYEVEEPFEDEEQERKRLNAINAHRHRELKKHEMQELKEQVEALRLANQEREALRLANQQVEALRMENQQLKAQLEAFQTKAVESQPSLFGNKDAVLFLDQFGI